MTNGTLFCEKVSRRSRDFFRELVDATKEWFCMVVSSPLSWGLGNIAKVYLITCSQSTCSKSKKTNFARYFSVELLI